MFAYCNNDPVANGDPSGHYIGHQPIIVCDNGWDHDSDECTWRQRDKQNQVITNSAPRDVSEEIDNALFAECLSVAIVKKLCGEKFWSLEKYVCFYKRVTHKAPWDIKRDTIWEKTIKTPFPGENEEVLYHGELMTPEQLGNFAYGFLGRIYGFPIEVLLLGSWMAAGRPTDGPILENEWMDQHYIAKGFGMPIEEIYGR